MGKVTQEFVPSPSDITFKGKPVEDSDVPVSTGWDDDGMKRTGGELAIMPSQEDMSNG